MSSRPLLIAALIVGLCMIPTHISAQDGEPPAQDLKPGQHPPPGSHNYAGQSDSPSRDKVEAMMKAAAAKPTPRSADGHPDLTGSWGAPELPLDAHKDDDGNFHVLALASKGGTAPILDATAEEQLAPEEIRITAPYKPELMGSVKELAQKSKFYNDPSGFCNPAGVPRAGAPGTIVQSPSAVAFFYPGEEGPSATFRIIAINQPHRTDVDPSPFGDSVGHWDSDTLVVDVTQISEDTPMGPGYLHSDALHVVERYSRIGNTLRREATADDSKVLTKAWVIPVQTRILNHDTVYYETTCQEREASHIVNHY
jgi:hypothetical protein